MDRAMDNQGSLSWSRRFLSVLLPLGLMAAGCTGIAGNVQAAPGSAKPSEHSGHEQQTPVAEAALERLTINVEIGDDGIQPSAIFIPAGRTALLVMRNRGTTEHHFRIVGMNPKELLWVAKDETAADLAQLASGLVSQVDHTAHHQEDTFVGFRSQSPAGIKPRDGEVHAYAQPGETDMVLFTATSVGTFSVQCPLHPALAAQVTVF